MKKENIELTYLVLMLIASIILLFGSIWKAYDRATQPETISFEQQIESLNKVEENINILSEFIKSQKNNLQQTQRTLTELKEQQEKLKPVVEADKKLVEAILSTHADKQRENIWWERAVGFFIGVVSSLSAAVIISLYRRRTHNNALKSGALQSDTAEL